MTNEIIKKYFALHEKFSKLKELISEGVKTVQDQQGHLEHEFEREITKKDENGQRIKEKTKVKLNERVLWEEVYHLGVEGHQAVDFLRNKYQDIFKSIDESNNLAKEIKIFELTNLGFSFTEMNGANLIMLVKALVKMEVGQGNGSCVFCTDWVTKLWSFIKGLFAKK